VSVETPTRLAAALPHVNLLPPEIGEQKRLQQVQLIGVLVLLLAVGAVAFLYVHGSGSVKTSKQHVATANADNAALNKQVAGFADVGQVNASLGAKEAMMTQAMSTEVLWSTYLGSFATLPTTSWLKSMTLSESLSPGTLTSVKQAPPIVATAAFDGVGMNYAALAGWLDKVAQLGQVNGLTNAYFSSATEAFIDSTKVVNFAGTANLSAVGLSGRCEKPGVC
jgi:hypothetical protein